MSRREFRVHGGASDGELGRSGVDRAPVLDFSISTNPYGPCPEVVEAVRTAVIDRYPDPTALAAREALARLLGATPEEIVLGNGAAELLWTVVRALRLDGGRALVVEPTFCEFRAACAASGATDVAQWRASEETSFAIDLEGVAETARACKARVVYLCSPNTPTGVSVPAAKIATWAEAHRRLTVVLDQSFLSLSDRFADATCKMPANVICVRSLTKDHAIPGIRLGYAVACPEIAASIEWCRPAWTTSAPAQAACLATCRHSRFVDESRGRLIDDRDGLFRELRCLGLYSFESSANFLLTRTERTAALKKRLLTRHGILVRDCTSFGLPGFIRLAARPVPERTSLIEALRQEL